MEVYIVKVRVKATFELLGRGVNFNIYDLSENSLKAFEYDKESLDYLYMLLKTYEKGRELDFSKFIQDKYRQCIVINYPDYPLPGSCFLDGTPLVNLGMLKATYLTDFSPADVYAAFAYSILFSNYVKNKPFKEDLVDQITLFIFNLMMSMYAKSSGLVGTYQNLAPKLRYIISLYTWQGLFGYKLDDSANRKLMASTHVDTTGMKLNYDFSSPAQFLRCIRDNGIIAISDNKFATDVIKYGKITSIPLFEDLSRMFTTLLCMSIKGNNLFSSYWSKKSKNIYDKMYYYGIRGLK